MVRCLFPRLKLLRAIVPRSNPILPTAALALRTHSPSIINIPQSGYIRRFQCFPARLTSSSPSNGSPTPDPRTTLPPDASLSQRLKHLIKSYGWYALGIYLAISVVDFGVAFVGINLLGAEYVSQVAATVKEAAARVVYSKVSEPGMDEMETVPPSAAASGQEGLYAMLVLAYTVHKTLFLPIRVGLTAALTPRFVGWLSRRGWVGGAGTRRAASEMRDKLRERRGSQDS